MALFQGIEMYSHSSAPSNPTADYVKIYFKGGYPYWRTDAGKEFRILDDLTAISARTELSSGLASADELLVDDAGTLKRMEVSVLQTYMQNNLTFSSGGYTFDWNGYTINDADATQILDGNGITKSTHITDPPASIRTVYLKLGQLTTIATQATDIAYMAVIDSSWNWKYMTKDNLNAIFGGNASDYVLDVDTSYGYIGSGTTSTIISESIMSSYQQDAVYHIVVAGHMFLSNLSGSNHTIKIEISTYGGNHQIMYNMITAEQQAISSYADFNYEAYIIVKQSSSPYDFVGSGKLIREPHSNAESISVTKGEAQSVTVSSFLDLLVKFETGIGATAKITQKYMKQIA